ncbi:MAG: PAS domain-containing protein, partial [Pirellulales bacterium]|nr:PAS domain-containing protein [Pirellulales bacterium]
MADAEIRADAENLDPSVLPSSILAMAKEFAWIAHPDGGPLKWIDPAAEKFFRRPADELLSDPQWRFRNMHAGDVEAVKKQLSRLSQDVQTEYEYRICGPDDEVTWIREPRRHRLEGPRHRFGVLGVAPDRRRLPAPHPVAVGDLDRHVGPGVAGAPRDAEAMTQL